MLIANRFSSADKLADPAAIANAIDTATAQLNACSVALSNLGLHDGYDSGSTGGLLLSSFCDAFKAYQRLAAPLAIAALARTLAEEAA